ncbi:unnamed protein product [Clavelina lepadiformis]|uniref:THUMP domain-containing protein n=1 Tax=Clavelina lepadiformis TaxID=159417 RepID=A0ABP0EYW3_CLALP
MGKRRKKFHSSNWQQKRAKYEGYGGKLEIGTCGILITHDRGKENFCRNDAFRLFNYFADEWYGPEHKDEKNDVPSKDGGLKTEDGDNENEEVEDDEDDCDDVHAALLKEVDVIKDMSSVNNKETRRFNSVKSGCNNIVFIKTHGLKPSEFVQNVIETIEEDKKTLAVARNVLRVHPADTSCKAHLADIKQQAEIYLPEAFEKFLTKNSTDNQANVPKQFNIVYRGRNNEHLHMHDVIDAISSAAQDACPMWRYNCRFEGLHLLVDVIKNVCTMGLAENYTKHKKFNVRELFFPKDPSPAVSEKLCQTEKTQTLIETDK